MIGNPLGQLFYSLDCFLFDIRLIGFSYTFDKIIWSILFPILFCFGFIVVYVFLVKYKAVLHRKSYVYSVLLFIFLYLQPNIIYFNLQNVMCY